MTDPLEAFKQAGAEVLRPLMCASRCSLRRRTSFGWVLEVCGACQKPEPTPPPTRGMTFGIMDRYAARLAEVGWDACPNWALRYLADGPKPVPFASFQLLGQHGEPSPSAPSWAVALLYLGTPMKSYVKKRGAVAIQWPRVFEMCAHDEEMRKALESVIHLTHEGTVGGRFAFNEFDCETVYDFLLANRDGVFGGVAQENTRLVVRSPK